MDDTQRKLNLLHRATGPSPWFWETFPTVIANSRQKFVWQHHGSEGQLAHLVTLSLAQEPDRPRLALNTYCTPFLIPGGKLGIWCPEPRELRLLCFDPDQLASFPIEEIVGWFKQSNDKVYSATEPLDEMAVSTRMSAGTHSLEVPEVFRSVDELLAIASRPAITKDDPACSIFALYLQAGLVEVMPQTWFTANAYDVGRQWITRLARDPETHRVLGDGARMGSFELTVTGDEVLEWIEKQ